MRRSRRLSIVPAAWGAGLVLALVLIPPYLANLQYSGDTAILIRNVRTILQAIQHGRWHDWGGHFPLLQQLVATPMVLVGAGDKEVETGLAWVSFAALLIVVVVSWRAVAPSSRSVATLVVAAELSGPLLWYGHASFAEALAAAVTVLLVAACLGRAPGPVIVGLLAIACTSKDVAIPFLAVLAAAACYLGAGSPPVAPLRAARLAAVAAGLLAGSALVLAFNVASYGSPVNTAVLKTTYIVPSFKIQASFFAAIWLSPNGGLVPYWISMVALVILGLAAGLHGFGSAGHLRRMTSALAAAAILLGLTVGFSRFAAPLGWIAWGPRYMIPWFPALAVLLGFAYGDHLESLLIRLSSRPAPATVLALVAILFALPQYVVLYQHGFGDRLFAVDAVCPRIPYVEQGQSYYYHCINHLLWAKRSVLLDAFRPGLGIPFLLALVWCAGYLCLLRLAVSQAAGSPRRSNLVAVGASRQQRPKR